METVKICETIDCSKPINDFQNHSCEGCDADISDLPIQQLSVQAIEAILRQKGLIPNPKDQVSSSQVAYCHSCAQEVPQANTSHAIQGLIHAGICPYCNESLHSENTDSIANQQTNTRVLLHCPWGTERLEGRLIVGRRKGLAWAEKLNYEVFGGVSREHAIITFHEESPSIQDEGSYNGTFVNGKRLLPKQSQQLKHGDKIEFSPELTVEVEIF